MLSKLEKLILKLRLCLHYIHVRPLLPLALHLEEEGIIDEVLDWVVIVREVKVRVDEGDAEIEILKKLVYCIRIFAILLSCHIPAFEKADFQILESVRIKISLQLIVLLLQAILFRDSIHLDLLLVRELKVLCVAGPIIQWPFNFCLRGASIDILNRNLIHIIEPN